jgi:hypothetical protein
MTFARQTPFFSIALRVGDSAMMISKPIFRPLKQSTSCRISLMGAPPLKRAEIPNTYHG